MKSLWQAIAIIMAVSIVSLGFRAGAIVALSIPLTLAIVFPVMESVGIDLQRISLGALIIALTLLVNDAMSTIDAMTMRLAAGDDKEHAATYSLQDAGLSDADRILRHHGGLRADRVRQEFRGRIHVFDLRGGELRGAGIMAGRSDFYSPCSVLRCSPSRSHREPSPARM